MEMTEGVKDKYDVLTRDDRLLEKRRGTPEDIGAVIQMLATGGLPTRQELLSRWTEEAPFPGCDRFTAQMSQHLVATKKLGCLTINSMSNRVPLLTPREAASILGISYATIKQWILNGKLKTVQTPGGHHRIAESTLKPFIVSDKQKPAEDSRERYRHVSGRNQLTGRVASVTIDGLLAKVVINVGDQKVTAIITSDAVREMGLKKGDAAAALVKATEVMIERI